MTETISDTMRASVMTGVGTLEIEDRPVPTPGAHEVLVEVAAVGVCGSDVHYYRHGRIGDFVVEDPMILGHELSGRIAAVGDQVDPTRVGQRVAVEPQHPCRRCKQCMAGRYNLCPYMEFYATPPIDGAFCRYVVIDAEFAHPVPDSMSDEAAALLEPLSVAVTTMRKAHVAPGTSVLIAGAGPIGVICAQTARAFGASASSCRIRWNRGARPCCASGRPRSSIRWSTTSPHSILRSTCSSTPAAPLLRSPAASRPSARPATSCWSGWARGLPVAHRPHPEHGDQRDRGVPLHRHLACGNPFGGLRCR